MQHLEDGAQYFLTVRGTDRESDARNKVAELMYADPRVGRIVKSVAWRQQLDPDDLRQDLVAVFLAEMLPKLLHPERVIGAVKRVAVTCALRAGDQRYHCDSPHFLALDDPDSASWAESLLGSDHSYDDRICDTIMSTRAKQALQSVLDNPGSSRLKVGHWLPTDVPKMERPAALPTDLRALPAASELAPHEAETKVRRRGAPTKRHEADEGQTRLAEMVAETGLRVEDFAEVLGITSWALRSYLSRYVHVPSAVLAKAEDWYTQEGANLAKWQRKISKKSIADLAADWKKRTGADTHRELAEILDVGVSTFHRWLKDTEDKQRPRAHRLLECERKVQEFEAGSR